MKILVVISLLALFSTGCSNSADPAQEATDSERLQVAETALRYMIDKSAKSDTGKFFEYVIEDGEFTKQLVEAFAGHTPQVVSDVHVNTSGEEAVDVAGNRVKLWAVSVVDVRPERAVANVKWTAGKLEASSLTLKLRKNDNGWFVESEMLKMIQ